LSCVWRETLDKFREVDFDENSLAFQRWDHRHFPQTESRLRDERKGTELSLCRKRNAFLPSLTGLYITETQR